MLLLRRLSPKPKPQTQFSDGRARIKVQLGMWSIDDVYITSLCAPCPLYNDICDVTHAAGLTSPVNGGVSNGRLSEDGSGHFEMPSEDEIVREFADYMVSVT